IKRLRTVPGVGPITALTWALEIGDVSRACPGHPCLHLTNDYMDVGNPEVTLPTGRSELGVLVLENGDSGNYLKS
ncbi:MAG TPA: transposase, partial [Candidatus Sulfotelmatobacter sp.]